MLYIAECGVSLSSLVTDYTVACAQNNWLALIHGQLRKSRPSRFDLSDPNGVATTVALSRGISR